MRNFSPLINLLQYCITSFGYHKPIIAHLFAPKFSLIHLLLCFKFHSHSNTSQMFKVFQDLPSAHLIFSVHSPSALTLPLPLLCQHLLSCVSPTSPSTPGSAHFLAFEPYSLRFSCSTATAAQRRCGQHVNGRACLGSIKFLILWPLKFEFYIIFTCHKIFF